MNSWHTKVQVRQGQGGAKEAQAEAAWQSEMGFFVQGLFLGAFYEN
jgi:hypothetical protein